MLFIVETFFVCLYLICIKRNCFMRKILFLLTALFALFACNNDDDELHGPVTHDKVDRTILIYMAANNSLYGNVQENLDSITAGYIDADTDGRLLVYLDNARTDAAVLYQYQIGADKQLVKQIIKEYQEPWNSVSPSNMSQVIKDAFSAYPAESYGIVLWSHALSWVPADKTLTRSWGDDAGYSMNIADLATTLESVPGVHFDFILFDACFMSTVEVAYDLRKASDYIIAAPTEILEFGFPYKSLTRQMFKYNSATISSLAECYADYYDGTTKTRNGIVTRMEGTMAMVKCSEMDNLASVTRAIMTAHVGDVPKVNPNSLQKYFRFNEHSFAYDFKDFMNTFATPSEMEVLEQQLDKAVPYKYTTDRFIGLNIDKDRYSGVATHVFKDRGNTWDNYYKTIGWYTAAGWDKVYEAE